MKTLLKIPPHLKRIATLHCERYMSGNYRWYETNLTNTIFDNCCRRYIANSGNFFLYRCTSTFFALKYCGGLFWNLSAIYTKWCTQTFLPIFELFIIFVNNFPIFVVPPSNKNENYLAYLKKRWKRHQNWPINSDTKPGQTNSMPASERDNKTKNIQTPYFRTCSQRALYYLPQTLHGDRACWSHQKRCQSFFDPMYSFSYRMYGRIRPKWQTCSFSAITP